jgi:hypothetical protein
MMMVHLRAAKMTILTACSVLAFIAISARGHVGGVMKLLLDGEASFTTRGIVKAGHPMPRTFTSKIISNAEISDVTMALDKAV